MQPFDQQPMTNYEKEDVVRRAITPPKDWVNPFPDIHPFELQIAERNLREVLADIRRAKFDWRMRQAEEDRRNNR